MMYMYLSDNPQLLSSFEQIVVVLQNLVSVMWEGDEIMGTKMGDSFTFLSAPEYQIPVIVAGPRKKMNKTIPCLLLTHWRRMILLKHAFPIGLSPSILGTSLQRVKWRH